MEDRLNSRSFSMKKILIALLIAHVLLIFCSTDSLAVTHYPLKLEVKSFETDFLKITDQDINVLFQGIYNADKGFSEILALPLNTNKLYINLGDSLQVIEVNKEVASHTVDFRPPAPSWLKRLAWLRTDLEKVLPLLFFVIIAILLKNRKKKSVIKDLEDDV